MGMRRASPRWPAAGEFRGAEMEHSEALYLTSSFCFASAAQAAARFAGDEPGNVYSRFTNPTVRAFEQRLAALEGGERCVATASGMSAILSVVMALLAAGDEIVASRSIFGTSVTLFNNVLARFGVTTRFVDMTDLDAWEAAMTPATRLLFLETPSNPLTEVADLDALAALARRHGAWLVVDNCFCTPALQPARARSDLVVHSATKFLDGQGRCLGGAIVAKRNSWAARYSFLRSAGPSMSSFNAWSFSRAGDPAAAHGRHSRNALIRRAGSKPSQRSHGSISRSPVTRSTNWRDVSSAISAVSSARGRRPREGLARRHHLRLFSITLTWATRKHRDPSATTTHGRLSGGREAAMGIGEGLLRLSVGPGGRPRRRPRPGARRRQLSDRLDSPTGPV